MEAGAAKPRTKYPNIKYRGRRGGDETQNFRSRYERRRDVN